MVAFDNEEWRSIPSEPNYEASSLGRVRRASVGAGTNKGRLLALNDCGDYLGVSTSHGGVLRHRYVHALVAEAFHGPRPDGMVARHKDGDGRNNCPSNLAYGTQQENILDKLRHGTMPRGEGHPNAKLTDEELMAAVADALQIGQHPAARKHGISQAALWRVINGKSRTNLFERIQALKAGSRGSVRLITPPDSLRAAA